MDLQHSKECNSKTTLEFECPDFKDGIEKYKELTKTLNMADLSPPEWLNHLETPFKWAQCLKPDLLCKMDLESKSEDYSYNSSFYTVEKCSLLLTMVFEQVILKDITESKSCLQKLRIELDNAAKNETNEIYARIGPALEHVYSATNAYLMTQSHDQQLKDVARNIASSLVPHDQMSSELQAGIEALKGKFYLWCYSDSNFALKHILEASKLDPDFAPWQYWTGKLLRKIRREFKENNPKEEMAYFESAVEKQRDPKHLIYLAQAYREKANFLHKSHSSDPEYRKSDTQKETDYLNKMSLDLYSTTQCSLSLDLSGCEAQAIKERVFSCEINIVVCSEKMDLIITANSIGEVSLHRSLDLQTVWTRKLADTKMKSVRKLSWRLDGQVIAIAYSYNDTGNSEGNSTIRRDSLVLVVSVENEELNSIKVEGEVTCLNWSECMTLTSSLPACFTNHLPEWVPLSNTFYSGVDIKKSKHLLKGEHERVMYFLVIGSLTGCLKILVDGFLSCCSLNINSPLQTENKIFFIRNAIFSSNIKLMFVLVEEVANHMFVIERDSKIVVLDAKVLSLKSSEVNLVKKRKVHIETLVDQIREVESCLTEVWECLKVAEFASKFNQYVLHFDNIDSMVADFTELILFGVLSNSLELFLLQSLNCNRVKNMLQSMKENCLYIEKLVTSHLKPYLEELLVILGEMKGMADLELFKALGIKKSFLVAAVQNVRILLLKSVEFFMLVKNLEKKYTEFFQWLSLLITQLNSDKVQELEFPCVTEENLNLITEFLQSFYQIASSYDEPISFFQHLGQYFEDKFLSKPLQPQHWQEFIGTRTDLINISCFIPANRTLSLHQVFKQVYESLERFCTASENNMSSLITVNQVIDLPATLLNCTVVESHYFNGNLSLTTALVRDESQGELYLTDIGAQETSSNSKFKFCSRRQKVLKVGNGNDYKCLDVKWYSGDSILTLCEGKENGSVFLVQIQKSAVDDYKSDVVNISSMKEGVFAWKIPCFPVLYFSISVKRKFGVAVSKNKKKILTFDLGFVDTVD